MAGSCRVALLQEGNDLCTEVRVPVREEYVRVEEGPVVAEEVLIGKQAVRGTKQVADTVGREGVVIGTSG